MINKNNTDDQLFRFTVILTSLILLLRLLATVFNFLEFFNAFYIFLFETITLGLYTALILLNQESLRNYKIDKTVLLLMVLIISLLIVGRRLDDVIGSISLLIIETLFVIVLIRQWNDLKFTKSVWIILGGSIGFLMPILFSLIQNSSFPELNFNGSTIFYFSSSFLAYFYSSSVMEEPLFRGFLWGILERKGFGEWVICFIQAGVFWIVHMNKLFTNTFTFWVALLIFGFILGILTMKSKSIAPSMLAHSMFNATALILLSKL